MPKASKSCLWINSMGHVTVHFSIRTLISEMDWYDGFRPKYSDCLLHMAYTECPLIPSWLWNTRQALVIILKVYAGVSLCSLYVVCRLGEELYDHVPRGVGQKIPGSPFLFVIFMESQGTATESVW